MCHFVMVDFNKDINIIKHNFFKRFCNVGLSGTVLHVASVSSSAHARNMPANMRDPKNYNFNAQHLIKFFIFILIIVKKSAEKWYHLLYYVHAISIYCKNEMLRSDWLIHKFDYI